jgi:DNA-binding LacI/PurR family transcriptional regulator
LLFWANEEENITRITQLLQQRPDTDGIFATVERLALSSYHACRRLGLSIPQTVKIIGFSNMEAAALLAPGLTTITQPAYAIGQEAAPHPAASRDQAPPSASLPKLGAEVRASGVGLHSWSLTRGS